MEEAKADEEVSKVVLSHGECLMKKSCWVKGICCEKNPNCKVECRNWMDLWKLDWIYKCCDYDNFSIDIQPSYILVIFSLT